MNADIHKIHSSPFFRIFDFDCREEAGAAPSSEWCADYCVSFVRKGSFGYRVGRKTFDVHSGTVLLENPGTEYEISHCHPVSDRCTNLCVDEGLLTEVAEAFGNAGLLNRQPRKDRFEFPVVLFPSVPQTDYLLALIHRAVTGGRHTNSLGLDMLGVKVLERIFAGLTDKSLPELQPIATKSKDLHLETIDRSKQFIIDNLHDNITLADIAASAFVSPFHFSRLFKHFTSFSPYEYLLEVRLNHSVLLLTNTSSSVTEICFDSGFNTLNHFITTFTRRYGTSPLKFRHSNSC